ncbi:MAG: helix-turn-helix transcriptional regulator [Corynebacterium sp.]|uniref:helix-turn-helix domain-containing protein n=1 Tax=Corynebacterium sp. TaxID=1720 RepID=UPI0026DF4E08|nr:helix-turn-helix transcriptional regulator [Corynebacterium sp.]MDO5669856.1 helix-turn-helix transcriptional regulator [Corynebacterium sp.]
MAQEPEWAGWASFGLTFGRNLRRLRKARGLTQEGLASLSGISRNSISNIERNIGNANKPADPKLSNIYRLARALDVPPAVLLPAGGEPVTEICPPEGYGITLHWPPETALERFLPGYADHQGLPRYRSDVEHIDGQVAREIVGEPTRRPAIEGGEDAKE